MDSDREQFRFEASFHTACFAGMTSKNVACTRASAPCLRRNYGIRDVLRYGRIIAARRNALGLKFLSSRGNNMHRSRLGGFIIDCKTDDLNAAAGFWAAALGYKTRHIENPHSGSYVVFDTAPNELDIEVQKVEHQSRVHIDI